MKNLKKSVAVLSILVAVVGTVAMARPHHKVSQERVQAAIDARLHQMLVDLNNRHRAAE